jgi:G:T-mismatch repair DNA endonuclease (very short patch repair protein)
MIRGKVTWNDVHEATRSELMATYKLNDRQLEQHLRKHLDGANAKDRRETYEKLYGKRK